MTFFQKNNLSTAIYQFLVGRKISSCIPQVGEWEKENKKLKQVPYHITMQAQIIT